MDNQPELEMEAPEDEKKKPEFENVSIGNRSALTPGDNNPTISVEETVGLVFMTLMAFVLLFALLRSNKRNRELLEKLAGMKG